MIKCPLLNVMPFFSVLCIHCAIIPKNAPSVSLCALRASMVKPISIQATISNSLKKSLEKHTRGNS